MDDEVIALIKQRNVLVMPNLAISENGTHADPPPWLDDPLLHDTAPAAVIDRVRASYKTRSADAVQRAQKVYRDMQSSLAKLNAAAVRIGFGTDAGAVRDHFYAYTDHRELQLMVNAGMTPVQALTAATVTSADFLRLKDRGTLDPGKSADFVVLDANPVDDIANTKRIARVYLRGQELDRAAMRNGWK
jgi:imidazolonepropionase-like amidohydrolase